MEYSTYKKLEFSKLEEKDFNKVVSDSEVLIDNLTQDFYQLHNIDDDLNSSDSFLNYRAKQYQRAICVQCEFASELGASTLIGQQNKALTDVQIGRTHLQRTSNAPNAVTYGKSGVVNSAFEILGRTGLLYRGADVYEYSHHSRYHG